MELEEEEEEKKKDQVMFIEVPNAHTHNLTSFHCVYKLRRPGGQKRANKTTENGIRKSFNFLLSLFLTLFGSFCWAHAKKYEMA